MSEKKSSTGLESNVAGLLSYLVGWVTGLIFFLIEQEDEFVRFHAMQSIIVFGAVTVVQIVLGILRGVFFFIPPIFILFTVLYSIVWLAAVVLWIVLMVRVYQGVRFKLPVAGDLAEKYSVKR